MFGVSLGRAPILPKVFEVLQEVSDGDPDRESNLGPCFQAPLFQQAPEPVVQFAAAVQALIDREVIGKAVLVG